jgi:hypothetical protein
MATVLTRRQKWSIKVLTALVLMACYHNNLRVCSYLLQAAFVPPYLLPWCKLYDKGDSSSFLHITGLTREAFDSLLYVVFLQVTQCAGDTGGGVVASAGWDVGAFTLISG